MSERIPYIFNRLTWAQGDDAISPIMVWEETEGRRRPTDVQQTDEEGRPLWRVKVAHDDALMRKTELVEVTVATTEEIPTIHYKDSLAFNGLQAKPGKYEFRFHASGVSVEKLDIDSILATSFDGEV